MSDTEQNRWEQYTNPFTQARHFAPHVTLHDRVITRSGFRNGLRILDVGCGTGDLLWRLRMLNVTGCHITGLDIAGQMLEHAQQEAQYYPGTADFRRLDLSQPLDSWEIEGLYDAIVCNRSLYPFSDLPHMLRKLARLAMPRATLVLVLPKANAESQPILDEHQSATGASPEEMVVVAELPIVKQAPTILARYQENLFSSREQLLRQFHRTGWENVQIEDAYAGQAWLVTAMRISSNKVHVWEATTPEDIRLALATRYEVLRSLESNTHADKQPGSPLDEFDELLPEGAKYVLATYNDLPVGCGRLLLGRLQSESLIRRSGMTLPDDLTGWAEPTRAGVFKEYQGKGAPGRAIVHQIVALMLGIARRHGRTHLMASILPAMAISQFKGRFPWRISARPVSFLPDENGPQVDEPIWAGTLDLAETAFVMKALRPDLYALMGGDNLAGSSHRPIGPLDAIQKRMARIEKWIRDYKKYAEDISASQPES